MDETDRNIDLQVIARKKRQKLLEAKGIIGEN